jgi:hypothetical protein
MTPKDVLRIILAEMVDYLTQTPSAAEFEDMFIGPDDLYVNTTDGRQFAIHAREVIRPGVASR